MHRRAVDASHTHNHPGAPKTAEVNVADPRLAMLSWLIAQMTSASEFSAARLYHRLLGELVTRFDAESAFLQHTDRALRASTLVAEWPAPDPGPAVKRSFADDVVLAGDLRTPVVIAPTTAVAPLLWGSVTTGVIGLAKAPGGRWTDGELEALGVVGALFAQFQARVTAESRLRRLAERDQLTDLPNRRMLFGEVRRRLLAGGPGPVAALYIDLDRLKTVNDQLGHAAGDVVIRTCAQRLRDFAGTRAMVARVGGDEFVVIPRTPMSCDTANAFAWQLRAAVRGPVRVGREVVNPTVSIGVAVGMPGIDIGEDLLHRADHAALAVKREGGDAAAVCDHEPPTPAPFLAGADGDVGLVAELHYQPEADVPTGEFVPVEALTKRPPVRALPRQACEGCRSRGAIDPSVRSAKPD